VGMTDAIDLTTEQRNQLTDLLRRFLPGVTVWAYGSRVKWTARPNSDLDLVVFATPAQRPQVAELKDALAESNLPFPVDLHVWDDVPERFREIIQKEYVVVQEAKPSESSSGCFGIADRWNSCTIGELCDAGVIELQTGPFGTQLHAHDYVEDGVPVVPTEAIRNRQIDHSVLPKISSGKAEELERHRLERGDILFARRGVQATGHIGCVREAEEGFLCGTGAIRLRVRKNGSSVNSDFLSHVLANPASVEWFKFHAIGATMPNLNEGIIRSFLLQLPPLPEQRAIAHILGTLDDKIELNRRMNETLEAMARALFKSWFIDFDPVRAKAEGRDPGLPKHIADLFPDSFEDSELGEIPKGWTVGHLGDVADHPRRGVQPNEMEPTTPYIALEHMPRHSIALSEWGTADGLESNKFKFEEGEILFGKLRPYFHKVGIAPVDGVCSTDIVVVTPRTEEWFGFVLGHISSDTFVEHTNASSTGTRMPRTSWSEMARYRVVVPPESVAKAFSAQIHTAADRIIASIHESHTLASLRHTLLPKLISGELRVKDAERFMESAV